MYALENNPTAVDILARSAACHPSAFREALETRAKQDNSWASMRPNGLARAAMISSAAATQRAIAALDAGNIAALAADMGAGIIALNIACKLQCLPPHLRTAAAVATWG